MNKDKIIPVLVEQLRLLSTKLSNSEKEQLRDELLSMLLFTDFIKNDAPLLGDNGQLKELNNQEKELIRKLASQTEALFKLMRNQNEDNE